VSSTPSKVRGEVNSSAPILRVLGSTAWKLTAYMLAAAVIGRKMNDMEVSFFITTLSSFWTSVR
jgi:hypothetical protein